jgi:hypothetical protein
MESRQAIWMESRQAIWMESRQAIWLDGATSFKIERKVRSVWVDGANRKAIGSERAICWRPFLQGGDGKGRVDEK